MIFAWRKSPSRVRLGPTKSFFNFFSIATTEKEVIGSLSHVYDEDFDTAVRLLADGRIEADLLISDRISLDDLLPRGLHRLENQAADTLKILVKPSVKREA